MATFEELVGGFEASLAAGRPADSGTPRTYRWAAETLGDFLVQSGAALAGFGPAQFEAFAQWLTARRHVDGRPWSPRSVRAAAKGSKSFLQWAAKYGFAPAVDLGQPRLPRVPDSRPEYLTREELARYLVESEAEDEPERTLLLLLPLTGCRARELCGAPMAGIGKDAGVPVLRVRRKGSTLSFDDVGRFDAHQCAVQLSSVPLNDAAQGVIRSYLAGFRRGVVGSPWLFPSPIDPARYLSYDGLKKAMHRVRGRLGISWLTSHKAGRHTMGMLLRQDGTPIEDIADALGHKNLETTRQFYAQADPDRVAETTNRVTGGNR